MDGARRWGGVGFVVVDNSKAALFGVGERRGIGPPVPIGDWSAVRRG